MRPVVSIIRPAATYTVAEVAVMLGQSPATIRRLIARKKLEQAPGVNAVRITHASLLKMLASAATGPFDLARELAENGPCLVVDPEAIARLYRIHVQTSYKMLARGGLRCIPWLWSRRVLKSEVARALGTSVAA